MSRTAGLRFLDLAQTLLVTLAHFVGHECAEAFFFGPKGVAVLADHFTTLWSSPFSPFDKGVRGSRHDACIVVGCCGADRCNSLPVNRGVAVNGSPRPEGFCANHDAGVVILDAEVGEDVLNVHAPAKVIATGRGKS